MYKFNIYIYTNVPSYIPAFFFCVVHPSNSSHKNSLIKLSLSLELRVTVRSTNSENWFFRKVIKCRRTSLAGELVSCWPEAQTPSVEIPRGILSGVQSNQKKRRNVGFFLKGKKGPEKREMVQKLMEKKTTGVVFWGFLEWWNGACSSLFSFLEKTSNHYYWTWLRKRIRPKTMRKSENPHLATFTTRKKCTLQSQSFSAGSP